MPQAIVIGATSGLGRALAELLVERGYRVGVTGRRTELLGELEARHGARIMPQPMDVARQAAARDQLAALWERLGDVELVVHCAAIAHLGSDVAWEQQQEMIDTNVSGFTAVVSLAFDRLAARGGGHLVNISSVAALRGSGRQVAYNATKAYASMYMDGLRHRTVLERLPVAITDVRPGFMDTAMARGPGVFWAVPPEEAARSVWGLIQRRRKRGSVTWGWSGLGWVMQYSPDFVYDRLTR